MEGGGERNPPPPWTERRQKSLDWMGLKVMLKLFYFPLFNHFIVFSSHDDTTASFGNQKHLYRENSTTIASLHFLQVLV